LGFSAGVLNLVPFVHGDLCSDGQRLFDLARYRLLGRRSAWLVAATREPDPHAATSVAPPG
jgi:hypothetical protein